MLLCGGSRSDGGRGRGRRKLGRRCRESRRRYMVSTLNRQRLFQL